jgi:hypothetical protein
VVVIVIIAAIYFAAGIRRGGGPVQPVGTVPEGPVKEGQPYGKVIPPGAPPFKKFRP